jgi:spore coat polysaccharide biosynthesis protein SpsF (cytidylyltransferase family)
MQSTSEPRLRIDEPISKAKTAAIIQARMGSTRLPGKVMMDLGGETVLARTVLRLRRARLVQEIVIATTTARADDVIIRECQRLHVPVYRGSETDVLDRYYHASLESGSDVVVRVTSDCPLIDPELVDETVRTLREQHADYASNVSPRTYPRGLDTEAFTVPALGRVWREAHESHQREHVTPYFHEHPKRFRLASASGPSDYSRYRWTVDTAEDLELIRTIYSRFGNQDHFGWRDVIALMESEPELAEVNSRVFQKSVHGN